MKLGTILYTAALVVTAAATASAQLSPFSDVNLPPQDPTISGDWSKTLFSGAEGLGTSSQTPVVRDQKGRILQSASLIGGADSVASTGYDLQTNATMMDRIINWGRNGVGPDGIKSSFIYMASTTLFPAVDDRGTYGMVRTDFGGGEGSWLPINLNSWARIEETRSGFCDLDYFKSGDLAGQLVAVSHANDNSGINVIVELDVAGSGEFLTIQVPGSERGLWPRLAIDGANGIHVIWTYQTGTAAPDIFANVLKYSRTTDFGTTWEGPFDMAPQTSVGLRGVTGGDSYQLDANGNNVALWYMDQGVRIIQLHSNANGAAGTWVPSLIASPRYTNVFSGLDGRVDSVLFNDPMYGADTIGFVSDTVPTPGSSFDMMVTDDGSVIGAFPQYPTFIRRFLLSGEDESAWNTRGGIITRDPNFEYTDRSFTFVHVLEDGQPIANSLVPLPDGVDNSAQFLNIASLTSGPGKQFNYEEGRARQPQIAVNESGQIFILFNSGEAGDVVSVDIPGFGVTDYYRGHIYAVRSTDNGTSWTTPQNLSPTGVDAQFGSLGDWVDDEAHIVVQADTYPGTYVNHGDTNGLRVHPPIFSNIETLIIPTNNFAPTSVHDAEAVYGTSRINAVSPNPAKGNVLLSYNIGRTGNARLDLVDATGRSVRTFFDGRRVAGEYSLSTNVSDLSNGQYFVVLTIDGVSKSTPMNVVR